MADLSFKGTTGQTLDRELLILCLNVAAAGETDSWKPFGKRVTDSSLSYDWSQESSKDILGHTYTTLKKPVVTQSFDPMPLEKGDPVHEKLWNLAVKEQNAQALAALDVLVVHAYVEAGTSQATKAFAERYSACALTVTGLGGEGGSHISMPNEITLGGTRTTGTATVTEEAGGAKKIEFDS